METYYLYILKSLRDNNLYVGCTSDLKKRLYRHKNGQIQSTKAKRPFVLVYVEKMYSKSEAFQKERFLKSLYGYKLKRKLIKEFDRAIPL